jgi:uncharacterized membrane protein
LKTKNNNKSNIIASTLLTGIFISYWFNIILLSIVGNIFLQLALCVVFYEKNNKLRIPLIIYYFLFLIGQAIGYGFNISYLKIYVHNGTESCFTIVGIVIPMILAFIINFTYQTCNKRVANK